jgi:hypothetical protein
MAKPKPTRRNALPAGGVGLAGEREYRFPEVSHARGAKARAVPMRPRDAIGAAQETYIDAKANRVLRKRSKPKGILG